MSRPRESGREALRQVREGRMHGLLGRRLADLSASRLADRRQLLDFEVLPPRPADRVEGE